MSTGTSGIQINQAQLQSVRTLLSDIQNGAKKAMVTAINKTMMTTKVQIKKKLGEQLNLKAARIEEDLSVEKASYENLSGRVVAKGEPVGLVNFAGSQLKKGVKVKVMKGGESKLLKHAFRKKVSGKEHLWWRQRRSDGRLVAKYHLERLEGPRIEDILAKPEIIDPINEQAVDLLVENLDKAVTEILRRNAL